jgi:hypothetical protein
VIYGINPLGYRWAYNASTPARSSEPWILLDWLIAKIKALFGSSSKPSEPDESEHAYYPLSDVASTTELGSGSSETSSDTDRSLTPPPVPPPSPQLTRIETVREASFPCVRERVSTRTMTLQRQLKVSHPDYMRTDCPEGSVLLREKSCSDIGYLRDQHYLFSEDLTRFGLDAETVIEHQKSGGRFEFVVAQNDRRSQAFNYPFRTLEDFGFSSDDPDVLSYKPFDGRFLIARSPDGDLLMPPVAEF